MPVRRRELLAWSPVLASLEFGLDDPSPLADGGMSWAPVIVDLTGHPAHDSLFRATSGRPPDQRTGPYGSPSTEARVLSGDARGARFGAAFAARELIRAEVKAFRKETKPADRLWVFVPGNPNAENSHAFLQPPGPDFGDDEFAALFQHVPAREQAFWIISAAAGSFLPGLSSPDRIVGTATGRTGEANEAEFPHVLAEVARRPAAPRFASASGAGRVDRAATIPKAVTGEQFDRAQAKIVTNRSSARRNDTTKD